MSERGWAKKIPKTPSREAKLEQKHAKEIVEKAAKANSEK